MGRELRLDSYGRRGRVGEQGVQSVPVDLTISPAAKDLLVRFDRLPEKEKVAVAREIWRRTAPIDSGPVENAETAAAADGIYAMLDKEEADASRRPAPR